MSPQRPRDPNQLAKSIVDLVRSDDLRFWDSSLEANQIQR